MNKTIKEIIAENPECVDVEYYAYRSDRNKTLHTDTILSLDNVPYEGIIPCDYFVLDENGYDNTICANTAHANFDEWYGNKEAKVLIIVLSEAQAKALDELNDYLSNVKNICRNSDGHYAYWDGGEKPHGAAYEIGTYFWYDHEERYMRDLIEACKTLGIALPPFIHDPMVNCEDDIYSACIALGENPDRYLTGAGYYEAETDKDKEDCLYTARDNCLDEAWAKAIDDWFNRYNNWLNSFGA